MPTCRNFAGQTNNEDASLHGHLEAHGYRKHSASFVVRAMEQGHEVDAITRAMNQIDQALADNPLAAGESCAEFERVLVVSPLVIDFEVYEEEHVVYVLRARYAPKRSGLI